MGINEGSLPFSWQANGKSLSISIPANSMSKLCFSGFRNITSKWSFCVHPVSKVGTVGTVGWYSWYLQRHIQQIVDKQKQKFAEYFSNSGLSKFMKTDYNYAHNGAFTNQILPILDHLICPSYYMYCTFKYIATYLNVQYV